jgi:hypothetical protein
VGFYDERCLVTGVSLKRTRAAAVLLGQTGAAHRPLALAVTGTYDRLGSIDHIRENDNTRLLLAYFLDRLRSGEFVIDEATYSYSDHHPIRKMEDLLYGFERNNNDGGRAALLRGQPVVFGLIWTRAWEVAAEVGKAGPDTDRFQRLFAGVPAAEEIYRGALTKVAQPLRELAAVCDFLESRGIAWRPPSEGGAQHYSEEMRDFLTAARRSFADCPQMLSTLEDYGDEIADPPADEDD